MLGNRNLCSIWIFWLLIFIISTNWQRCFKLFKIICLSLLVYYLVPVPNKIIGLLSLFCCWIMDIVTACATQQCWLDQDFPFLRLWWKIPLTVFQLGLGFSMDWFDLLRVHELANWAICCRLYNQKFSLSVACLYPCNWFISCAILCYLIISLAYFTFCSSLFL